MIPPIPPSSSTYFELPPPPINRAYRVVMAINNDSPKKVEALQDLIDPHLPLHYREQAFLSLQETLIANGSFDELEQMIEHAHPDLEPVKNRTIALFVDFLIRIRDLSRAERVTLQTLCPILRTQYLNRISNILILQKALPEAARIIDMIPLEDVRSRCSSHIKELMIALNHLKKK